jgi:hypothetical protein
MDELRRERDRRDAGRHNVLEQLGQAKGG